MKTGLILRTSTDDQGTPGTLTFERGGDNGEGHACKTWELPWRGNAPDISCLAVGIHRVTRWESPSKGWVWRLLDTGPRALILIHPYNLAGDVLKGYAKQALGCIAPGLGFGTFPAGETFRVEGPAGPEEVQLTQDQRGIISSVAAFAALNAYLGSDDWMLTIRDGWAPAAAPEVA